ncbi:MULTISPECIES: hypothetical protein [Methylobacterium]|uniref:hypothetical protein n=1 Tax=Methylobacterium TaxID=407 RepID=UPI0013ED1A30|nr:hypothetical protein [Methylobacterium sp. DB0501]NGM37958.1 hypothetical protein [Methylobacterium sp. DB0501]
MRTIHGLRDDFVKGLLIGRAQVAREGHGARLDRRWKARMAASPDHPSPATATSTRVRKPQLWRDAESLTAGADEANQQHSKNYSIRIISDNKIKAYSGGRFLVLLPYR